MNSRAAGVGLAAVLLLLAVGCASPGPALPPSLKLPEVVKDLQAARVGDVVRLGWTTPGRTTDGLTLVGPMTAEICREVGGAPKAGAQGCSPVARIPVTAGASEWSDALGGLAVGMPRLLTYRVQMRNAAGRTAGASGAAFAASGAGPEPVEGLRVRAAKGGAVVEWTAAGAGDVVELSRVLEAAPVDAAAAKKDAVVRLRVGSGAHDAGGTIDRTAEVGKSYEYTAERVRTEVLGSHALEVRSVASGAVGVMMADVFPPEAPEGLVSSPGFASVGASGQRPVIDLSWEPGVEARIAGYRVYRREMDGGQWVRVSGAVVALPSYRDETVVAGRRYGYRVTAVDEAGNESAAGNEVEETAPVP